MSLATRVLIGFFAGLVSGLALRVLPPDLAHGVIRVLEPVGTLWVNGIRMTIVPLVFSTVLVGIGEAAEAGSFVRLGGRALVVFVAWTAGVGLIAMAVVPPLVAHLPMDPAAILALQVEAASQAAPAAEAASRLPDIGEWLTSLVPVNPIAAAAEGALLPLLVFALSFGVALSRTPESVRSPLLGVMRGVAAASIVLVNWILALAPIGVFALGIPLAARAGVAVAGLIGAYMLLVCALVAGLTLLVYPVAVLLGRVSFRQFARACLPAQAVAVGARSSIAALPAMLETAETELGISKGVAAFLLPLAVSVQKISLPLTITTGVLFLAALAGRTPDTNALATIVFAAILLSFAAPGIPSASVMMQVPILLAVGLPASGVGLLLAVDLLPDVFKTTAHVTADMASVLIADRWAGGSRSRNAAAPGEAS